MLYDVIVIGGGPGGCRAAEFACRNGLQTVLFEKEELGGVCLNHGCIPTKTLLYAVRLHDQMKYDASKFGVTADKLRLDPIVLWERKDRTIRRLRAALSHRLKGVGVEVVKAEAQIVGKLGDNFIVTANNCRYEGKNLILATGGRPHIPAIAGLREALETGFAVTPRQLLATPTIPLSLIILGGGCIGIEFATFYRSAGSTVTVVEQNPAIASGLDERLSAFLLTNQRKRGVEFQLNVQAVSVASNGISLDNGTVLKADKLLLACGWEASSVSGLQSDAGSSCIAPGAYWIGDATGRNFLAPVAEREAEAAINMILGKPDHIDYTMIPHVVFADPEIAGVGLTLPQARQIDPDAFEKHLPLSLSARYAIEHPTENGFGICVYSGLNKLLGIHFAGTGAVELLNSYQITQAIHPSIAEWENKVEHP